VAAGVGVTFFSKELVWYGAIVVGIIEMARGLSGMKQARKRTRT